MISHSLSGHDYLIYSDGSCLGNPGPGGWAFIVLHKSHTWSILETFSGSNPDTTNNRMEMIAGLEALKWLLEKKISPCIIKTDSQYLCQGIKNWLPNWKKRGWKTAQGHPVKNQDLWREIDRIQNHTHVQWEWVKGHSVDQWNQKVDIAARNAALNAAAQTKES